MSSYKLPFGLILEETAVILLLLVYRLLLLRYVLVVSHNNSATLSSRMTFGALLPASTRIFFPSR